MKRCTGLSTLISRNDKGRGARVRPWASGARLNAVYSWPVSNMPHLRLIASSGKVRP
jgi:hypothetical protein